MKAYHGTNKIIDFFTLDHLGTGQGNSSFPGIYFTTSLYEAQNYAEYAANRKGGRPLVYEVELELTGTPFITGKSKFFSTRAVLMYFVKKYFPQWIIDGALRTNIRDYVNGKFNSVQGQYSLIQYAAENNKISAVDIVKDLGYDYALDGAQDIVITDPNQIDSYTLITPLVSATETTAQGLLNISKSADPYKGRPGSRYTQRTRIKSLPGRQEWQQIDVNKFFKTGHLLFHIPIRGETDTYVVEMEIQNFLKVLKNALASQPFTLPIVRTSLMSALMTNDVKVECSCPDFRYRLANPLTLAGDNSGTPQSIRAEKTNPHDSKGRGCKHILYCLSSKSSFVDQIARTLVNYTATLARNNAALFSRVIEPALGITANKAAGKPEPVEEPKPIEEPKPEEETEVPEKATEGYYGSYYANANLYDDDQMFMLQLANDRGVRISDFVSPKNTPEQLGELTDIFEEYPFFTPEQKKILADPDLPFQSLRVLASAFAQKIDLSKEAKIYDSKVLTQLLKARLLKIPIDPANFNYKQIEQLISAYKLDKKLFEDLYNNRYNYEEMRSAISRFKATR